MVSIPFSTSSFRSSSNSLPSVSHWNYSTANQILSPLQRKDTIIETRSSRDSRFQFALLSVDSHKRLLKSCLCNLILHPYTGGKKTKKTWTNMALWARLEKAMSIECFASLASVYHPDVNLTLYVRVVLREKCGFNKVQAWPSFTGVLHTT